MGLAPADADAQGDRAAGRMPHHPAGRLRGHHRQRTGVDQPGLAQVPRPDRAAGLLVADAVDHDPAGGEQPELACGRGAVDHADQAALHVGGAAADDPAVAPARGELLAALRGDDVEVAVEVERAVSLAGGPADDPRLPEPLGGVELDHLRCESQAVQRVPQDLGARGQAAARRVLGIDRDQPLEQVGHRVGSSLDPGRQRCGRIGHLPGARRLWTVARSISSLLAPSRALKRLPAASVTSATSTANSQSTVRSARIRRLRWAARR